MCPPPPACAPSLHSPQVFRYAACSPSCFVLALVYVERLGFHCVSPKSVHRVVRCCARRGAGAEARRGTCAHTPRPPTPPFPPPQVLAACLVATKWLDDSVHANSYWAKARPPKKPNPLFSL